MRSSPARVAATSVAVVVATCAALVVALPVLTGSAAAKPGGSVPPWLQRVNDVRLAAGVAALTENSSWTQGIQHHLTYLELTPASYRTGQYASAHTENPASPYYTADGALEGSRSNLVKHASQTATSAVDYWFGAPFHAIGMLRAGLQQTAFAQDDTYAGMDVISGYSTSIRSASPILFPGPGSTTSLTAYSGNESPDPIETCRKAAPAADYSAPGLPLIAMLPSAPANNLTATLTTPGGVVLSSTSADLCVVDENTYYSSDTVYGSTGQQILSTDHAVVLVPRVPLVAGTYSVRISQAKQPDIAWSFVVGPSSPASTSPTTSAPTTTTAPTTTAPTTTAATTTAPTSTAPTSTAPTSTAPTSTAPTSTAPTSTAPTSTAPTTAPATTPATTPTTTPTTTASTSAPPLAGAPEVSISDVTCSYGTRATGSAALAVTNPDDGAGDATYSVAVGGRSAGTDVVPDGSGGTATLTRLPGGSQEGSVAGSDGTSAVFPLQVPTCPAYQGVRVEIHRLTGHRVRIRLDNSRNAHTTRFRVVIGGQGTRHPVPGAEVRRMRASLPRATVVRVYVGQHEVARARLRP